MRKAVYTSIFGRYDRLIPHPVVDGVDWIAFTDDPNLPPENWDVRFSSGPGYASSSLNAKYFKMLPHAFLPEYDRTLWIDANVSLLPSFVPETFYFLDGSPMILFKHPNRSCIYDEAEVSLNPSWDKYAGQPLREQVDYYRSLGHPERWGLFCGGIVARDSSDVRIRLFGEAWFHETRRWSLQDQLPLPFLLRSMRTPFATFPIDLFDVRWGTLRPHEQY